MITPGIEFSVKVEAADDAAVVVTYVGNDGSVYRGALVKMKAWSCPGIPSSSSSEYTAVASGNTNGKNGLAPGESEEVLGRDGSVNSSVAHVSQEADDAERRNPDFAALQHRWSYLEKNVPPLPRRNIASRKEKEKFDQVPKLRPRNFLCTKCKFALPGFTQPQSGSNSSQATPVSGGNVPLAAAMDATDSGVGAQQVTSDNNGNKQTSPSHTRKRKVPVKRTTARPSLVENFLMQNEMQPESCMLSTAASGTSAFTAENSNSQTSTDSQDAAELANKHSKMADLLAQKKPHKRIKPNVEVATPGVNDETPAATILPSPTGEGLKIKFKLSTASASTNPSPERQVEVAKEKPRRTRGPNRNKAAKGAVAEQPIVTATVPAVQGDDDDEFLQPRLRIDESPSPSPIPPAVATPVTANLTPSSTGTSMAPSVGMNNSVKRKRGRQKQVEAQPIQVPPKPPPNVIETASTLKPVARPVSRCLTKDGRTFAVDDVVWGKLTGYPWWPGKINHIVVCDDPMLQKTASASTFKDPLAPPMLQYQEAQIEWFGQKSSISYIEVCQLSHYVDDYDKRFKPKVRGSYQEAVKLATSSVSNRQNGQAAAGDTLLEQVEEDEDIEPDIFSQIALQLTRDRQMVNSAAPPPAMPNLNDPYAFSGGVEMSFPGTSVPAGHPQGFRRTSAQGYHRENRGGLSSHHL